MRKSIIPGGMIELAVLKERGLFDDNATPRPYTEMGPAMRVIVKIKEETAIWLYGRKK